MNIKFENMTKNELDQLMRDLQSCFSRDTIFQSLKDTESIFAQKELKCLKGNGYNDHLNKDIFIKDITPKNSGNINLTVDIVVNSENKDNGFTVLKLRDCGVIARINAKMLFEELYELNKYGLLED